MRAWELIEKHGVRSVEQLKARPALASEIWGDLGRSGEIWEEPRPVGTAPTLGSVLWRCGTRRAPRSSPRRGPSTTSHTSRSSTRPSRGTRSSSTRRVSPSSRGGRTPGYAPSPRDPAPRKEILLPQLALVFSCIRPYSQLYSLASASLVFTRCSHAVNIRQQPFHSTDGRHNFSRAVWFVQPRLAYFTA